jgi:hypothetical protein
MSRSRQKRDIHKWPDITSWHPTRQPDGIDMGWDIVTSDGDKMVVTENVRISKDVWERGEPVSGRVRREDVVIEGDDAVKTGDRP